LKTDRLRVGILGCGAAGSRRRVIAEAHPALQVVALCDPAGVRIAGSAAICGGLQELLAQRLHVLFVCATPDIAASSTIAGLEAGLHVFCEKPPAPTPAELQAVLDVERRRPAQRLMYGFTHRWQASVRRAHAVVASGALGRLINLRGVYGKSSLAPPDGWRRRAEISGGGILIDQGIHMLDLFRWFAGDFRDVLAFAGREAPGAVEDNVYALLRTPSGVVATLHSSATEWRHRFSLDVALTEGSVSLDGLLTSSRSYAPERLVIRRRRAGGFPSEETMEFADDVAWSDEVDAFVQSVQTSASPPQGTSADALAALDLVHRVWAAADAHR
jgi:predicted dehydrogenase